jgi:RimJ/RimL family protein N-acetyltransferase
MISLENGFDLKAIEAKNDSIKQIALLPEVSKHLTEKWIYPEGMPDELNYALLKGDRIIGQAAFKSVRWFNRKAELSLFIHPDFHHQGIGTQVLRAMIALAFDRLNFHRLEAEVLAYNTAARKMMEKLSFNAEGCLREARFFEGRYYDIFRYALLRNDYKINLNHEKS